MKSVIFFLILTASALISSIASFGQITVDATGPMRERVRVASTSRGGGVGRKVPLRVSIAVLGGWDDEGKVEVDFTLTNAGPDAVTIPTSPNPGDFEPVDPKVGYSVTCLSVQVIPRKTPGGILAGGAVLYGNSKIPGTLVMLASGDSIRVLTRVALPRSPPSEPNIPFVASAMLNNETIKTVNGRIISEMQEIGSASSAEYRLGSLLRISGY